MKYVYPAMLVLSFIMNVVVVLIISKKFKYTKFELLSMIVIETFGFIVGGKLLTIITTEAILKDFILVPFSSMGGVIGGLLCLVIYAISFRKDLKYMLILFMPSIPLMYAIGKIGCFVAGCCYGIPYDGLLHITYHNSLVAPHNINLLPIQIIETLVFILIFIYVIRFYYLNRMSIILIMKEIIICSIAKFILDYFRYSHIDQVINANQILCIILIIISMLYMLKIKKKV